MYKSRAVSDWGRNAQRLVALTFAGCFVAAGAAYATEVANAYVPMRQIALGQYLPILILIASLAGDEFRLKEVLINIVVLTLGSWAIFIKGLSLVIPLWPAFMTA